MPNDQPVWTVADLVAQVPAEQGVLVASPSVGERVSASLPYRRVELAEAPVGVSWLIVAGGGRLIDAAKLWRVAESPQTRLAAVPSIWGSGAESSPIAVTHGATKDIAFSPDLRPEVRVRWPSLAEGLPSHLARWASGDALTHATEALLSPLGDDALRTELGRLLSRMVRGLPDVGAWLDASAEACALQSRASVGLVHGIAHVLEPALWTEGRRPLAAHARLCAAWLGPVLRFNLRASPKAADRLQRYGIAPDVLLAAADSVGDAQTVAETVPDVRRLWTEIIRDRCSRTNVALVRPSDLESLLDGLA